MRDGREGRAGADREPDDQNSSLFAGVRTARLLGLVWFDAVGSRDWRLSNAAATTAFRRAAGAYKMPLS